MKKNEENSRIDKMWWIDDDLKRRMKEANKKLDKDVKNFDKFLNNLEKQSIENKNTLEETKLELKQLSKRITKLEMANEKNRK